jgi:hypothetical protein
LCEISFQIMSIVGLAYIPLLVLIIFRVGRTGGLTETPNVEDRIWDICIDTIQGQIESKVHELVISYYGNEFHLPPGRNYAEVSMHLHQNSQSLEQLLPILRNLSELHIHSTEFQQVSEFISHLF